MFRLALLASLAVHLSVLSAEQPTRPNIVVILTDDQGWGDLSINGNADVRTPNLDSLATDGAKFERFFVQPVCSPTRAEFLTGRWHPRGGVRDVTTGGERLNLGETTVAEAFDAAGYATGCFGKWHNGSQFPYHPIGRGFREFYGFSSGHWGTYFDARLDHNGEDTTAKGYLANNLAERAAEFVTKNAAAHKPFFCYLAFNIPHSPMQVPDADWKRFADRELKQTLPGGRADHTRAALAMCENLDTNVGKVLAALRKAQIERDTIVVFFSDNGPNGRRWNGAMKGIKGSTDEGGVRSPLHVRWPAKIEKGTVVAPIAATIDLYPTLIDLAGIPRSGDKPFDGISLAPWLRDKAKPAPDRVLIQHWAGKISARDQRFRLDPAGHLYDLNADPGQMNDIATNHPDAVLRLTQAATAWKKEVLGSLPATDNRPHPVGHPAFPRTLLPAQDGVPHGGIKRSASAPNCSYFTGWTKPSDQMTWDIEVSTAGTYEAIVHYTCPKLDIGSELELSLAKAKWSGVVSMAIDPPLQGESDDRVKRTGESLMKEFQALSLGTTELPAGRGVLTLTASKVAAGQVAHVRAIELILKKKS